jgi:cytochrome c oxidase cbb3-type subunit 1
MSTNEISRVASSEPLVFRPIVKAHIIAGFVFFFASLFAGLLYALQLSRLYPFPGVELLSPGRMRMLHTNAIAYGFLFNNFIAALLWIVPRLTGKPVLSKNLSWFVFWAWQGIVGATAVGLIGGQAQAIEWGETPVWIDPVVVVGAAALIVNIATPILKVANRKLYVTLWYFSAMMVWLPLTYVMGNFVPQYFVPARAARPSPASTFTTSSASPSPRSAGA